MKDHSKEISRILDIITANESFVLTSHINPDGDGLGSELALYHLLKELGKNVTILNASPIPETFGFLDSENRYFTLYDESYRDTLLNADVVFVLDISVMHRLGDVGTVIGESNALTICIDHHSSNSFNGDLFLIDEDAVSTAELIYMLMKQAGFKLTKKIAEALYVSILTDTGCFRFSNTNAETHRLAAELLNCGVDHYYFYNRIYEHNSWEKTVLFAATFGDIRRTHDGRVAWMKITYDMFGKTGTGYEDIEGFVEYPRNIKDVQVSILFVERHDGCVKVSFRSSGDVSIDKLAAEFGGGGHRNAAAAVFEEPDFEKAIEMVLAASERHLH